MQQPNGKKRIGILVCGNSHQDMNCNSTLCLLDFQRGRSAFAGQPDRELIGIISCAGCPTLAAPEKILHRVRPLVDLGAEAIHISSCMMMLCPFKQKYKGLIEKAFPQIAVVEGTHFPPEGMSAEEAGKQFVQCAHDMLCAPRPAMAIVAQALYPDEFPAPQ
jgi:predicted metal-binding protein